MPQVVTAWIREHKKDFFVLLFFVLVSSVSVLYSLSLPYVVNGDTYIVLLATKTETDIGYPDRDILQKMDFRPYLYPDVLEFFNEHFSLQDTTYILLFILVLCTGFSAYAALRMLDFSRVVSVMVSLIALFPRASIGSEIWGVFTYGEVLGRTFGLPVLWLLSAWFIRRKYDKKTLWPVFFVGGLAVYIHPVSIIFFSGILFLIQLYYLVTEKKYTEGLKDFWLSILAFCASASFLLVKILSSTSQISQGKSGAVSVSGAEYAEAILSRMRWNYPPTSTLWLRHVVIVSFLFILAVLWTWYRIYKKKDKETYTLYREIFNFCVPLIVLSVFLSVFLPYFQMWLIREYGWALVLQQESRIFKYYYLALYFLFAVALALFLKRYRIKKYTLVPIVIIGIISSSFGLEWFEFLVGYRNYSEEMIPVVFQKKNFENEAVRYAEICRQAEKVGVKENDLVISDDFPLRYYCKMNLFITQEEGMSYMMSGKNEMVWWFREYREQALALNRTPDVLLRFAERTKAQYALIPKDSPLVKEFDDRKMVVSHGETYSIIKF